MTDKKFELTRRKILAGLGGVGFASAGAGLGTSAYFSDTESFDDNTVTAGTLDLSVDYSETVVQDVTTTDSGTVDGTPPTDTFTVSNVQPGDYGEIAFSFTIDANPGYVWTFCPAHTESENGVTEPEGESTMESAGVELADRVAVEFWYDDGDGVPEGGETVAYQGNLREMMAVFGTASRPVTDGFPLDAAPDNGDAAPAAFAPGTQHNVGLRWEVPTEIGNEIQSDSLTFDIGFYAEQARHNTRTHTVNGSGGDLQTAIDEASAGDVVNVNGGSYAGPVVVEKPGVTIEATSGSSPLITATDGVVPPTQSGAVKNQQAALRVGAKAYGTVVDGVDVSRELEPSATNGDSNSKAVGLRASASTLRDATVEVENPSGSDKQASGVFVANDTVGFGTGVGVASPQLHGVTLENVDVTSAGNRDAITGVAVVSLTPYGYPFGSTPFAGVANTTIGGSIDEASVGVVSGGFDQGFGPAAPVTGLDTTGASFGPNVGTNVDTV